MEEKRAPAATPAPGRRARSAPSRRVLAIGLLGTGLFATGLGAGADAQAPAITATPTPETVPTEPLVGDPVPAATPTPTPEPTPVEPAPSATPEPEPSATPTEPAPTATTAPAPPPPSPAAVEPAVATATPSKPTSPAVRSVEHAAHDRSKATTPSAVHRRAEPAPAPTPAPSLFTAPPSTGVPTFFISSFRIPPFLLPIYQAAAKRYGVPWEVLAAINEIETDYGRNLDVSSAGAVGWMQFLPSTWARYGVDADRDGVADPGNPADAVFAAARYLRAAGAGTDLRKAVFAYNHASWYVDSVLQRARLIGALPGGLVASLAGLAQGRFPVPAGATYAGQRRSIRISARAGAAVVAVNDGRILHLGRTKLLGRFVRLRDVYGNTYTYARLKQVGPRRAVTGKVRLFAHRPGGARGAIRITELRPGARVAAGTILGRVGHTHGRRTPYMLFQIRPAGAPRIDPRPILDGWRLLGGRRSSAETPVMSKAALAARVLADPRVKIYDCGRQDIRAGAIDRRVLATLEFLADSGLDPTVSALKCGHSFLTSSGNVSEHSSGSAVDIAALNGIPVAGHQGPGSVTETAVRRLLSLQGAMKPHQIISLMRFSGTDNTFAMADHADHIHVGWRPDDAAGGA